MNAAHLFGVLLAVGVAHANAQGTSGLTTPTPPASAASMPLVEGEVQQLDLATGLIVLKHGDIPNLAMPPMTMGFDVTDRKMLRGLKVGDKVRFQAEMIKGQATVTELKRSR
jgi:Cu(I)/Ag(I) efflux system membrane protein CusA/SilA